MSSRYLHSEAGEPHNAATFSLTRHLAGVEPRLLETSEGRRLLTRLDPLMFALLYLPHHMRGKQTGEQVTFADCHLDWAREARGWVRPVTEPRSSRDVYISPRESAKSTWWFLINPMWAAANGFIKFVAAFSDSATQAENHLSTFKAELDGNQLLREDFPKFTRPATRSRGTVVADRQSQIQTASGFTFAARGIDSGNLGLKVGHQRPDALICDDIESGEANYSLHQAGKRLSTLQNVILPLSEFARVVVAGTTTMSGGLIHQCVKSATIPGPPADWIRDENFRVHYYPPIIATEEGERSIWPAKWPMTYLEDVRSTRSFKLNFLNQPASLDGDYWSPEDFRYPEPGEALDPAPRMMLSVDPAVTSKATSDFTGLSVVSHDPGRRRCTVHAALQVKLPPAGLRDKILAMLDEFPQISLVLVEDNQGGDVWAHILHGLPVKLRTVHQSAPKAVRAASVLNRYQRGQVIHAKPLRDLEEQMCAFPKAANDDILDSVVSAVQRFLDPAKSKAPATAASRTYL